MCFDAKTSIITFIIGTIFNLLGIIYFKDSIYTAMALVWQFVLSMQIFDAIAWLNNKCGTFWNKFATRGAYVANMMQPVAIFMAFIAITPVSRQLKIIATILITIYIGWILGTSQNIGKKDCLVPDNSCNHLDYYWWNLNQNQTKKQSSININFVMYFITLSSIIFLLVRPFSLSIINYTYITITLLISSFLYKCGTASIWCFFAAFAPILNFVVYKYILKK